MLKCKNDIKLMLEQVKNDHEKTVIVSLEPGIRTSDEDEEAFNRSIEKFMASRYKGFNKLLLCDFANLIQEQDIFHLQYQTYIKLKNAWPGHTSKLVVISCDKETIIDLLEWLLEEFNNENIVSPFFFSVYDDFNERVLSFTKGTEDVTC